MAHLMVELLVSTVLETLRLNCGFDYFDGFVDCAGYFGFDDCQPTVRHRLRISSRLCSPLKRELEEFHPLFPVLLLLYPSATRWEYVVWLMPVQIEHVAKVRDLTMNPPD